MSLCELHVEMIVSDMYGVKYITKVTGFYFFDGAATRLKLYTWAAFLWDSITLWQMANEHFP